VALTVTSMCPLAPSVAEQSTPAGYWTKSDQGSDDSDVGTVDKWDLYWLSHTGIGYDVQCHAQSG